VTDAESSPAGTWLSTTNNAFSVAPGGGQATFTINVTEPGGGPQFLQGTVTVATDDPNNPTLVINVNVWSGDAIAEPNIYDTAATSTDWGAKGLGDDVALTVSNHGEMGNLGQGFVNLDFVQSGTDCDDGATVYLYSGSPFALIKGGANTAAHYDTVSSSNPNTWVPLTDALISSGLGSRNGADFDSVFTGKMANRDSTLWMERTYFAPRNNTANPSFVVVRTVLGTDVGVTDSIIVGDIIDWDVPSDQDDVSSATNVGGTTQPFEEQFAYIQGTDTAGSDACISNTRRFATNAFFEMYSNTNPTPSDLYWNSWVIPVRDTGDAAPTGLFDKDTLTNDYQYDLWWDSLLNITGNLSTNLNRDLGQFLTYEIRTGLAVSDTVYYWTILATGYDMADYTELEANVADAKTFALALRGPCETSCCVGLRGDVDGDGDPSVPTLSDFSALIDYLFISLEDLDCWEEGNVDGELPEGPTSVTLSDLSALIDNLFISLDDTPPCP
jgi:hypothetical protein